MNFKKNILVTGGAGFIGSNLLTYFIQNIRIITSLLLIFCRMPHVMTT